MMTAERMKLAVGCTVETSVNMYFDEKTAETKEKTAGRKNFEQTEIEEENAGKEIVKNSDGEMTALTLEKTDSILGKRRSETDCLLPVEKTVMTTVVLETETGKLG